MSNCLVLKSIVIIVLDSVVVVCKVLLPINCRCNNC